MLLALETATDACSVALADGRTLLVELSLHRPRAHAEHLVSLIQDALRYADADRSAIQAIAVSAGPGSYTGLRIGASTAKGLALALDVPLVAVPSLEALAASAAPHGQPGEGVATFFNARRNEVYAAAFRWEAEGALVPLRPTTALPLDALAAWMGTPDLTRLWLMGEGASRALPHLAYAELSLHPLDPAFFGPSARWIARLGNERLHAGQVENIAAFEPQYQKAFVAKKPSASAFEKLPF